MALKHVVLPAPLGPIKPVTAPGVDGEVDAAQRVHPSESNFGFRYLQKRHHLPPLRSNWSRVRAQERGPRLHLFVLVTQVFFVTN